ncbi:fumarylacetoacetate hydrolase family protein [Sutterella sp.]|uniref:fumarylacetoacetate hydrolase family protein n=1 Tax=Sutterella sp. TaxID=1981025 RepID=UPI0026E02F11|nr:fumarylacetoacetate hydrolase family protein [Sutterella sp.]MDO5532279.1 fumarylacetoacetate hydrolase family protein [Sutterella sp.]
MPFVFAPPAQVVIPVADERYEFFPVNRVYGAAKNYAATQAERDAKAGFHPPIFMKSPDVIRPVADGETYRWPMPPGTVKMVPEFELVACLGRGGRNLTAEEAEAAVWGWCVGYDFTRRLSAEDCPPGSPWDLMKTLDGGAPVSHVRPAFRTPLPAPTDIYLYKNNQRVQSASTSLMLANPIELIMLISRFWELRPGDVIFTGTPAGVPDCQVGDQFEGGVNGVGKLRVEVTAPVA